jgi:FkbM family methyltransferase
MKRGGIVLAVAILAGAIPALRWGRPLRDQMQQNSECCQVPFFRNLALSARQLRGELQFFAEVGQDIWLTETVFPGKTTGFFLDVGSGHGTIGSNSRLLEMKGWTGICIDPFPKYMDGRTCAMVKEVVFDKAGGKVAFKAAGDLGGVADTLGKWNERAAQAPTVEFTTTTLGDILARQHAPSTIDFMSLDVEGAELAALKGLPLEKYTIGAMTIEHNFEEPKRSDIEKFLQARGYRRVHSMKQDDFYLNSSLRK